MSKAAKSLFDPNLFLAKVGEGTTILNFEKNVAVFRKGTPQILFSISERERSRFSLSPSRARRPWSESWSPDNSSAKDA